MWPHAGSTGAFLEVGLGDDHARRPGAVRRQQGHVRGDELLLDPLAPTRRRGASTGVSSRRPDLGRGVRCAASVIGVMTVRGTGRHADGVPAMRTSLMAV